MIKVIVPVAILRKYNYRFYKTKGSLHIAAGSLVSALEYSTGAECKVIGKPSKEFFDLALTFIGLVFTLSQKLFSNYNYLK